MESISGTAKNCGDTDVSAGRGPGQLAWYEFARRFVKGKSVLDVGCGLGDSIDILRAAAAHVHGQDLDERLAGPDTTIGPISQFESKRFDVITSIDVIEHVEDVPAYLTDLARIAREGFFLTTPNWTASRCRWPYHLREYTPRELRLALKPFGRVTLYKGLPTGTEVHPIRFTRLNHWFNTLRAFPPSALPAKLLNNTLPSSFRIHSHLAAWVDLR